jgi:SAM-dependent methyltransferase
MDTKAHWDKVYRDKGPDQVSWFQAEARLSRKLIERAAPDRNSSILDVGAGASTLVDGLLASGYRRLTVLDLSAAALALTQSRLGVEAQHVTLLEGDVLTTPFATAAFDVWHDRAVFHFLTDPAQRSRYIAQVRHAVRPGGHVLVATFADDGPLRCSGLDVSRYSAEELHGVFGADFQLVTSTREDHVTPSGAHQAFVYCLCRIPPSVG